MLPGLPLIGQIPVKLVDEGVAWPAWISTGAAVATLLIVFATAWFARNQLKDAQRTRHSQLILSLNDQWAVLAESLSLYWKYPPDELADLIERLYGVGKEPLADDLKDFEDLRTTINLAETIAVLRKQRAITTDVIYDMWGATIYNLRLSWKAALPKLREHTGEPDLLEAFDDLSRDIEKRVLERAPARRPLHRTNGAGSASPAGEGVAPESSGSSSSRPSQSVASVQQDHRSASVVRTLTQALLAVLALSVAVRFFRRHVRDQ